MKKIITINKDFPDLKGEVVEILPVSEWRKQELYRVKYENGKYGQLDRKDFKYLD